MNRLKRIIAGMTIVMLILIIAVFAVSCRHAKVIRSDGWEIKTLTDNTAELVRCYQGEKSLSIPEYIFGYKITSIGQEAFSYCNHTDITIPDGVTSIGDGAFERGRSLKYITIPSSVTSIGNGAFRGCDFLASITLPKGVTSIGHEAFAGCESLTSITIPDSVRSIGDKAFYWCGGLTSITIPNGVTSIGEGTFEYCESLTSITISNRVISIGNRAFSGCHNLVRIIIPDSVTSIGDRAFSNCNSLTSVTIPDSVTKIGDGAFEDCDSLTIHYQGTEAEWSSLTSASNTEKSKLTALWIVIGVALGVIVGGGFTLLWYNLRKKPNTPAKTND